MSVFTQQLALLASLSTAQRARYFCVDASHGGQGLPHEHLKFERTEGNVADNDRDDNSYFAKRSSFLLRRSEKMSFPAAFFFSS